MLMTGHDYIESIRDGREVWIDGEKVKDVPSHAAFKPVVDVRARVYDMAHEDDHRDVMVQAADDGEDCSVSWTPPKTKDDLYAKWRWVDEVMEDIGGVVYRLGDETIGAVWSLLDGKDVLHDVDPRFTANIGRHIDVAQRQDLFTVSGNTDPKGDRSRPPQDQDPDMLLHAVKETDAGLVVRGAKYETAAAYAHQAFVKPTIANWGDAKMSDYALGFHVSDGRQGPQTHMPFEPGQGQERQGLPQHHHVRRDRHPARLRRCVDPLGGRLFLSAHPGSGFYPQHAAPL